MLWGGSWFARLAAAGLVDSVEVGVMPVILGAGIPLMAPGGAHVELELLKDDAGDAVRELSPGQRGSSLVLRPSVELPVSSFVLLVYQV
jgi:hypothetical protein